MAKYGNLQTAFALNEIDLRKYMYIQNINSNIIHVQIYSNVHN